ncbi:MAG: hypothetical protein H7Z12_04210 [Rhodospirillaceae bacterium]|nr:hypothetical protein [Rhodospirillales bacterium]
MSAITGLTFLALVTVTACSTKPREMDMLVWSKVDWDPRQEQRDYGECYTHAKKAAYRKYHWRRTALSREVDEPTGAMTPAAIMIKLQDIAGDEKLATVEIAEQCMEARGYRLVPVNHASR